MKWINYLTNIFPLSSSLRMTNHCKRDGNASWRTFLKANLCVLKRNKKIRFLTSVNFGNTFYTYLRIKTTDTTQIRRVIYLTNRFHVAVRLFSNRSQMTSKCGKNKEVVRLVCHLCFYHILTSSVIYYWTDPRQHEIYLFYTMIRKENRPIHIPASYRLTVRGFVLILRHFLSSKRYFSSLFLLFSLSYLYTVSSKSFSTPFLAQSRIMAITFCKTASLS